MTLLSVTAAPSPAPRRRWKRALRAAILLYGVAMTAVAIAGWRCTPEPADAAIVLGTTVHPNGKPSRRLSWRIREAASLYEQGYARLIIVSGARGKEGFDEAAVMKIALIGYGIPADHIVTDNQGDNTRLTAQNAARILKDRGMTSAIMVSQYFHLPRAIWSLKRAGIADVSGAHPDDMEWRDVYSLAREVAATLSYRWRD